MSDSNLTFRGQREDEEVILLIHRHPWALLKAGLIMALAIAVIILAFVFFKASGPAVWTFFIIGPIALVYGLYHWFMWWNSLYLLTNQRVIVIAQNSLWSRRIEDYGLDKIQSVASDTDGAAGTFLNFGTVMLAIMGIKDQVALRFVEDAYTVQEKILTATKNQGKEPVEINQYDRPKHKKRLIQH